MNYRQLFTCTSLLFTSLASMAQTHSETLGSQRAFVYVERSSPHTISCGSSDAAPLLRYAKSHEGTYLVFAENGTLHRLDRPAQMTELEHGYAPMRELEAKQKALGAEQAPLAARQRALAAQQRAASAPDEMRRIGELQGALGEQQGALGAKQGAIGEQQGALGRQFSAKVQDMLNACLADGSCPAVSTEAAKR